MVMVGPLDGGRKPEGQQGEHATSAQKGTSQFQTKDLLAVTVLTTTVLRLDGNQGHYMIIWWRHSLNQSTVNHPFYSKWAILSSMRLETSD